MSLTVETGGESAQVSSERNPGLLSDAEPPGASLPRDKPATEFEGISRAGATPATAPAPQIIHRHGLLQAFQSLVYIIVIALFIITFSVQPFRIPSASMEPTLLVGDFLLVNKQVSPEVSPRVFAPTSQIHRGDLIVFHYPVNPSLQLVKRVVGLPGYHLRLRDGHVYVDGHALPEPYAVFRPSAPDSYRDDFPRVASADPGVDSRWWIQMHSLISDGQLTVPSDSYFVLGDNRNDSEDSRYWGFVPHAAIVGKPFLIYFSLKNLDNAPGQITGNDPSIVTPRHDATLGSLVDFARWDRALRIIH